MTRIIKIKVIEDGPESELALWTLKAAILREPSLIIIDSIEEADIVIAARHYFIKDQLDQINGRKLIWINYGSTLKSITNLPVKDTGDAHSYDATDKLLAIISPNDSYKEVLTSWGVDTSRVYSFGYPKMELVYYNYTENIETLGLNPKFEKTVLYTPTLGWKTSTSHSSFFEYINKLVYLSLEYKFNLVIRPHPHLLKHFPETKEILNNICKLNNVCYNNSYNYYGIFIASNFIISDLSSLAYEYLSTTKPVIITRAYLNHNKLFKEYIDNGVMYEAKKYDELETRVRLLLKNEDELMNRRVAFVASIPAKPSRLIIDFIKGQVK